MHKIALFDKPLPYTVQYKSDSPARQSEGFWKEWYYATIHTPKRQRVAMEAQITNFKAGVSEISMDGAASDMYVVFENPDSDVPYGTTGKGEEFVIFATVSKFILETFDKTRAKHEANKIVVRFDSDIGDVSRRKLYTKLATGLARMRGGQTAIRESAYQIIYKIIFSPKRPPAEQDPANPL